MRGVLSTTDQDVERLVRHARETPKLGQQDLVSEVTCREPYPWSEGREQGWGGGLNIEPREERLRCVAYDFGVKRNILRLLRDSGFDVTVVPAGTPAEETLALAPDAVFLSNGPGDPAVPTYAISAVGGLIGRLPVFGICLGHQIAALALGAKTVKLKFGHRGANHPVQDLRTGKVAVTSQNHGYAVDPDSLPQGVDLTHVNLNDGTCEGFVCHEKRLLAVQYHPEASPGPRDSLDLFSEFARLVAGPVGESRTTDGDSSAREPHSAPSMLGEQADV
jgi:carbamoyl-phosphate synthase small subunit